MKYVVIALFCVSTSIFSHPLDDLIKSEYDIKIEKAAGTVQLRRLSLNLRGVIPRAYEVEKAMGAEFSLADSARTYLKSPEFAQYWAEILGSMFREKAQVRGADFGAYFRYLSSSLHENKPYDEMVSEMILSSGSVEKNPAALFYLRDNADPLEIAEYTGRVFYGKRFSCARCHDHPYDKKFTRRDYYGLAAFFSQVWVRNRFKNEFLPRERRAHLPRKEKEKYDLHEREYRQKYLRNLSAAQRKEYQKKNRLKYAEVVYEPMLGLRFPFTDDSPGGDLVKPRFPYGETAFLEPGEDRRKSFVNWLTARENDRFRKVILNRIYTRLMGYGFFEEFDNWDAEKTSHKKILEHLDVVYQEKGLRFKDIIYYIVTSTAYQRRAPSGNDEKKHEGVQHYVTRKLNGAQLFNSLVQGTRQKTLLAMNERSNSNDFKGSGALLFPVEKQRKFENSCQVGRPTRFNNFLSVFGAGDRNDIDDDNHEITIEQVLTLMNGRVSSNVVRNIGKNDDYARLYDKEKKMLPVFALLFRSLLSRNMTESEKAMLNKMSQSRLHAGRKGFKREMLQDLAFSIINSDEFVHLY